MNLEIASEYLVMASELIELKSKLLLPSETIDEDDEFIEDCRDDLVNRLLEYEAYKKITETLKKQEEIRQEIYTKNPSNVSNYIEDDNVTMVDGDLDALIDAFQKFLARKKESKPLATKVTENEITVSSRRHDIKNILKREKRVSFFRLFPVVSKEYIVATFLAILEMAKAQELFIVQDKTFDDIICEVR